ncbi:uncharacterized protein LOC131880689 [Tigriopus californicus]|uniref:uncharacterized protein LOC131880689 n=1 Tax=Tigriopus californicus TaxID=6832 RepID=UPI0027DA62D5|nr:uncharacterized protein LOC131880689 [Tigriopus californicus]|eukprot:TCALIF_09589-PA protein Name:"Similar to OSTM1 Osteopetrosis-associated transmembrane protein 1 (Homo sapiens)" AED:0.01 eAED:0.01 QI:274/1/0.8/1/0.75/0.4/5/0/379
MAHLQLSISRGGGPRRFFSVSFGLSPWWVLGVVLLLQPSPSHLTSSEDLSRADPGLDFSSLSHASALPRIVLDTLDDRPAGSPDWGCTHKLLAFGDALAQFKYCVTSYAHPVSFCFNCQGQKINVETTYEILNQTESVMGPGPVSVPTRRNCMDRFLNQDRLNVVQTSYQEVLGRDSLWARGYCHACYVPGNKSLVIRNTTAQAMFYFGQADDCFIQYDAMREGEPKNTVCTVCQDRYDVALDYYREHFYFKYGSSKVLDEICIDLQDKWNKTVRAWAYQYKCVDEFKLGLGFHLLSLASMMPLVLSFMIPCFTRWFPAWFAHTDEDIVVDYHNYGPNYANLGRRPRGELSDEENEPDHTPEPEQETPPRSSDSEGPAR